MINYIIIEDEVAAFNDLRAMLDKAFSGKLNFIGMTDNIEDGIFIINEKNPDLVFLDIQLNDGLAFELLDHFNDDVNFEVIFTSGYSDYKEIAMDYFAFYFLEKPIQKEKLERVLMRFLNKKSVFDLTKYSLLKNQIENQKKSIALPSSNATFNIIRLDDLIYCEADGSYTNYYTTDNKKYVSSNNLKKIEALLNNTSFYRIHRSILLNLKHVKKFHVNGKITLTNNKTLIVSARNKKSFFNIIKLMNYTID